MAAQKLKIDLDSPEYQAAMREVVHGTFVREGTLVAFPLCFPDVTVPIPPDESRITALDCAEGGSVIYGGTSGRRTHVFVAMFHGATGMVYDLGAVDDATCCTAICCLAGEFVACVNGPHGGRLICRELEPAPFDLIQEWFFERKPLTDLGAPAPGEPIIHAVVEAGGKGLVGVTSRHLFRWTASTRRIEVLDELNCAGRLLALPDGAIYGPDAERRLWRWDAAQSRLTRRTVALPSGEWTPEQWHWAVAPDTGAAYVADATGRIFAFDAVAGFTGPLGRAPLAPVGPMAVTRDGRVFGFCGDGIARLFCLDPAARSVRDLGCAVSVIQRRRYGYQFGAAAAGRDGELIFGENDDGGHLWIYFPGIARPAKI